MNEDEPTGEVLINILRGMQNTLRED